MEMNRKQIKENEANKMNYIEFFFLIIKRQIAP